MGSARDWQREIDEWTERFRGVADPPEPFATALRDGWTAAMRETLARDAQEYLERHEGWVSQIRSGGMDLVRFDCKSGSCPHCAPYCGCAYSLAGEHEELPPPPPLPICPACRHTLNLLTPFFMQGMGLDMDDLIQESVPYSPPE